MTTLANELMGLVKPPIPKNARLCVPMPDDETVLCPVCGNEKHISKFYTYKSGPRIGQFVYERCMDCVNANKRFRRNK